MNTRISRSVSLLLWPLIVVLLMISAGRLAAGENLSVLLELVEESSEPFSDIDSADLSGLLQRIGDSRVVLLGESTHGTAEFYDMRAHITRALIEQKGFNIVAIEGDWPDASHIDHFVRERRYAPLFSGRPFDMFPRWMWRNESVMDFTLWLKDYNRRFRTVDDAVGFYGLDLYNLYASIDAVLTYLQSVDPVMAEYADSKYRCLLPWRDNPSHYGRDMRLAAKVRPVKGCEQAVKDVWLAIANNHEFYRQQHSHLYFTALQNARLVRNAERYFRTLYTDSTGVWNLRDNNMFDTLQAVMAYRGDEAKAVVWAQNIHIGDARATDMAESGEINLGQRVRQHYGDSAYLIGFGTDHGMVSAAPGWGEPVKRMRVPPAHVDSYEYLFHQLDIENFLLPLRHSKPPALREKLKAVRLERAIGVAFDPKNEMKKHYYAASLANQFDEYIWFDETRAVVPLDK